MYKVIMNTSTVLSAHYAFALSDHDLVSTSLSPAVSPPSRAASWVLHNATHHNQMAFLPFFPAHHTHTRTHLWVLSVGRWCWGLPSDGIWDSLMWSLSRARQSLTLVTAAWDVALSSRISCDHTYHGSCQAKGLWIITTLSVGDNPACEELV